MNDYDFKIAFEHQIMRNMKRNLSFMFLGYSVIVILVGFFVNQSSNFFTALVMMGLFGMFFGYFLVVQYLRFVGRLNERYFSIVMGQNDHIDYSNVVG